MNMKHNAKLYYKKLKDIFFLILFIAAVHVLMVIIDILFGLLIITKSTITDYNNNDILTFLWNRLLHVWEVISLF